MYSVREAAAKLGMTDRHVRFLLARKVIAGKKLGHDWVVLSLDYKRRRKPKIMRGQTTAREKAPKWEDTWTEGGL
jgi:hypothetical protein